MQTTAMSDAAKSRVKGPFCFLMILLLGLDALAHADGVKPPTGPSAGKALVCIYRVYRFTGSASHDSLFVNETPVGTLLNSEYACTEVAPGTVVIAGLPKMYYGGVTQSIGAALAEARKKENERARFEAEAGKSYYFKWTAGAMATGIKVTQEDASVATKEMEKLHPTKPPEAAAEQAPATGDAKK